MINRLAILTASNHGMPINTILCINKSVQQYDKTIILQAASIYTQGDGEDWSVNEMMKIMLDIATSALTALGSRLFKQLTTHKQE